MSYGLDHSAIRRIIIQSIERNPDLKYYVDNDYIYELVDAIVDGVSAAIEENTKTVIRQIERELRGRR